MLSKLRLRQLICSTALALSSAIPTLAQSQSIEGLDLDNMLQMAWESTWHESGMPYGTVKWTKRIRLHLTGEKIGRFREDFLGLMQQYSELTGVQFEEVAATDTTATMRVEIVAQDARATGGTACYTQPRWDGSGIVHARIVIPAEHFSWCTLHELGHAFGVLGHPLSKSVMTYFNKTHQLSDYDRFLLGTLYSSHVRHGQTPFYFVKMVGERFIRALPDDTEKAQAQAQLTAFLLARLQEMERFVDGTGEVPRVLYRSGKLRPDIAEAGKISMAWFLAHGYAFAHVVPRDEVKAEKYFTFGAKKGLPFSQLALASLYQRAQAPLRSQAQAHAWFSCAARNGLKQAQTAMQTLEASAKAEDLELWKAGTTEFFAANRCLILPVSPAK